MRALGTSSNVTLNLARIARHPSFECDYCSDHPLLSGLHWAADAVQLVHTRTHQIKAAGNDSGGHPLERLLPTNQCHVRACCEIRTNVQLRRRIDDNGNASIV